MKISVSVEALTKGTLQLMKTKPTPPTYDDLVAALTAMFCAYRDGQPAALHSAFLAARAVLGAVEDERVARAEARNANCK